MPQQRIYYDYIDGKLMPYIYVLTFQNGEINWDKPLFEYEAIKPFKHDDIYDFDHSILTCSIFFTDFIFNNNRPLHFKLNLTSIKSRLERDYIDPYVIKQFVLGTFELQELLQLLPKERSMKLFLEVI